MYHQEVLEILKLEGIKADSEVPIGIYNVDILVKRDGYLSLGLEVSDPVTKQFLSEYSSPG